jgi:hypothetical protein
MIFFLIKYIINQKDVYMPFKYTSTIKIYIVLLLNIFLNYQFIILIILSIYH